jgi:hypothetical protein
VKPGDEPSRRLAARQNASQGAGRIRLRLCGDGLRVPAVVQDASSRLSAWPDWGESGEARRALSAGQFAVHWGWMPVQSGRFCWCLLRRVAAS